MKKHLAILLAAVLLLCAAPLAGFTAIELPEFDFSSIFTVPANAATIVASGTCGEVNAKKGLDGSNLTWTLDSDGLLTISGSGQMRYSSWEEYPWYRNASLHSVIIQPGVTNIGSSIFDGCTGLTKVTIPNTVISIADGSFHDCINLSEVIIPESVNRINQAAFLGCIGLTSIVIPSSVTYIGESAFSGCKGLTSVTLSEGLTWLGIGAFSGCSSLTSIEIPESVTSIGYWLFGGCPALTELIVKEGNPTYCSAGNCIIHKETKKLVVGCDHSTIPTDGSVEIIGLYSFDGCNDLAYLVIPACVTMIGRLPEHILIYCYADSYAQQWAEEKNHTFKIIGDVDGNGKVESADARLALRASVKLETYTEGTAPFLTADYDKNGKIESSDARAILRVSVKLDPFA